MNWSTAARKVMFGFVVAQLSLADSPLSSSIALQNDEAQLVDGEAAQLEQFATAYTNVYFALGACDGFIKPQDEAPFDPYGPALAKWPDSFKRQMAETREEGRVEAARLARQHGFSLEERIELCKRQLDSAKLDLARVKARYGEDP